MAPLFQRQNSLQQKAQRSVTVKQSAWRSPFILCAAVIFLLFVWIDSRDELLVRKLESPNASQTVSSFKQVPGLPKSNDQTDLSSSQTDLSSAQESLESSYQTQSRNARKHLESRDQKELGRAQKLHESSYQTDLSSTQGHPQASSQTEFRRAQKHPEGSSQTDLSNAQEHRKSSDETELRSAQEHHGSSDQKDLSSAQELPDLSSRADLSSTQEHHEESYQTQSRSSREHRESSTLAELSSVQTDSSSAHERLESIDQTDLQKCNGRRIFVYDLPAEFNDDLTKDCKNWRNWQEWSMCDDVTNGGFGERMNLPASDPIAAILQPPSAWFQTDQFSLEVILHRRLKTYPCLTQDATQASIFYIPFYHALDLTRHIYNANLTTRDYLAKRVVKWLGRQPSFRLHHGQRHVITLGRVVWDFWRHDSGPWTGKWGSPFLAFPELGNVTKLFIERCAWTGSHQVAIPYPTSFHPSSQSELQSWQSTVRKAHRPHLVSFAGSSRSRNMSGTVRGELFDQCARSWQCEHLICTEELCHKTSRTIYKMALESVFCLQPAGDSFTRKGIFDSLLAGCIPVVFSRNQTVLQYLWHLTGDGSRYSVLIDGEAVIHHYDVIQHLERMPRDEVARLQESVVEFIPQIVYRNPELDGDYTSKDAFDVIIDSLLETFDGEDSRMRDKSASAKL